jgi:hypothetical protein
MASDRNLPFAALGMPVGLVTTDPFGDWPRCPRWAVILRATVALPAIELFCYSPESSTTAGHGDWVSRAPWRFVGLMASGAGNLMFGWSAGMMVAVLPTTHGNRPAN